MKSKNFIIDLVIYPLDVMVSIGESDKKLKKKLKKVGMQWDDEMVCDENVKGRFFMNEKNQSLIRLREYPKTPFHFGILAHEIFHAATHVLDVVGIKMVIGKSDEACAYLIQYITKEIYKKIK